MLLFQAEYRRIGMLDEMERYFTGSGGTPTEAAFEEELASYRAVPTGAGFDAYCKQVGIDAAYVRRMYQEINATPPNEEL
jgi:hypothetical protein